MSVGTPLLQTLGQVQQPHGSSDPVRRPNRTPPESSELTKEARVSALSWQSTIEALSRFHESHDQEQMPEWVPKALRGTDQSDVFCPKKPEFSHSDLSPFGTPGPETPGTFATRPEDASPYSARVTGPVKFVQQLLVTWQLEPEDACILLGFEPSRLAYVNNVLQGYGTLTGRDAKDRIVHLIQIRTALSALFRDETVENEWLREPRDVLQGQTPMDLLLEGSMENLLLVKEYVALVART